MLFTQELEQRGEGSFNPLYGDKPLWQGLFEEHVTQL